MNEQKDSASEGVSEAAPELIWMNPRHAGLYAQPEHMRDPNDTVEYARVHQPSEQNLEDKNLVSGASDYSTSRIPKDILSDAAASTGAWIKANPHASARDACAELIRRIEARLPMPRERPSTSDVLGNPDRGTRARNQTESPESASTLVTVDEVSKALEELRVMFPSTWIFVADRATWTQGCESPTRSAVIEIERKENAFFGTTLSEAIKRVRVSKEQDNAKS